MSLKAELREKVGSGSAKKVREAGLVPATLYGKGSDAVSLTVNRRELDVVLKTQGLSQAFELEFDGKKENVAPSCRRSRGRAGSRWRTGSATPSLRAPS